MQIAATIRALPAVSGRPNFDSFKSFSWKISAIRYAEVLKILKDENTFMVAGGFAVNAYTGLNRATKDIDIFCKAGDYPKILNRFTALGLQNAGARVVSRNFTHWHVEHSVQGRLNMNSEACPRI